MEWISTMHQHPGLLSPTVQCEAGAGCPVTGPWTGSPLIRGRYMRRVSECRIPDHTVEIIFNEPLTRDYLLIKYGTDRALDSVLIQYVSIALKFPSNFKQEHQTII